MITPPWPRCPNCHRELVLVGEFMECFVCFECRACGIELTVTTDASE